VASGNVLGEPVPRRRSVNTIEMRPDQVKDELGDTDPTILAEMVRNLQVRMMGMEREVKRHRAKSPGGMEEHPTARVSRATSDVNDPANDRPPVSFRGYLDDLHTRRQVDEQIEVNPTKIPDRKLLKLQIRPFDGSEKYPDLGADFQRWGQQFLEEISGERFTLVFSGAKT
jgi:hypothetical protein